MLIKQDYHHWSNPFKNPKSSIIAFSFLVHPETISTLRITLQEKAMHIHAAGRFVQCPLIIHPLFLPPSSSFKVTHFPLITQNDSINHAPPIPYIWTRWKTKMRESDQIMMERVASSYLFPMGSRLRDEAMSTILYFGHEFKKTLQ